MKTGYAGIGSFESSVISLGNETGRTPSPSSSAFESSVISLGNETLNIIEIMR